MAQPGVLNKFVRVRCTTGENVNQQDFPVAASQTIQQFDVVMLSSGKVQQAITASGADAVVASGGNLAVLGVAMGSITTGSSVTAADKIPVAIFDDNLQVALRLTGATSTVSGAGASSQPGSWDVASNYQLGRYQKSSGITWYVLTSATTNGEFKVEEAQSPSTEDFGVVWVKPIASMRQLG